MLFLTGFAIITGAILTGCHTPSITNDNTQSTDTDSSKAKGISTKAYMADIDTYRVQIADSIDVNEKCISTCTTKISKDDRETREGYKKRIDVLEQKNSDMKRDMEEYRADGKKKWEKFKVDFEYNMSELSKSIRDLRDSII